MCVTSPPLRLAHRPHILIELMAAYFSRSLSETGELRADLLGGGRASEGECRAKQVLECQVIPHNCEDVVSGGQPPHLLLESRHHDLWWHRNDF